jgi:transcriptional regulator with XRE-family HTH domain
MVLGSRMRERRRERGLSQERLANQAGVTLSAIQRLEAGQVSDPHYSTLTGIAHALGTTVAELVGEKELFPLDEAPSQGPPVVVVGATPEEAAEKLEQQLYAPARIAQGWHRLAQRWEERLERGDFDARSLKDFVDTLEDVVLSLQANVAAERGVLRAQYGKDVARNRSVLRPALDRLFMLVDEALQEGLPKIDAKELEAEAGLADNLVLLRDHLKMAS